MPSIGAGEGAVLVVQRTLQEKKRLGYLKDCRNWYGENDKSSRKNIRLNKQAVNKSNRRRPRTALAVLRGAAEPELAALTGERLARTRPQVWRKCADTPLGEYVQGRLERRARLGMTTPAATG
ncbi:hypothetical protein [Kitasatospora sp. P5_F3]